MIVNLPILPSRERTNMFKLLSISLLLLASTVDASERHGCWTKPPTPSPKDSPRKDNSPKDSPVNSFNNSPKNSPKVSPRNDKK